MIKQLPQGKILLAVLFLVTVILLGGGLFFSKDLTKNEEEILPVAELDTETEVLMMETETISDVMIKDINTEMMDAMVVMTYQYSGELLDVTGSKATGLAQADIDGDSYTLYATFENLPTPKGTDFYEGWVVRKGPEFSVVSTGRLEENEGEYTNLYSSGKDLTDHTFYVLTIEPDDSDPSPAAHILEGTMIVK